MYSIRITFPYSKRGTRISKAYEILLGWDSGEVTTTLSVYPKDGGVISPSMMNHFSSKALELRSGAQELQKQNGCFALGGRRAGRG